MHHFRKSLLILCLLIPLAVLAWSALPCAAGAEEAGPVPQAELTATADPNNPISVAFANLINQVGTPAEEVQLEALTLEEYGDSPRVRSLTRSDKGEPSYLVYREDLYLIPHEEAAAYTVARSADGRTAELSPALPAGALEGKTGIVILGEDIGSDIVILFDGEPVLTETGLTATVPAQEEITLSRIFSDGQFTTSVSPSAPARFAEETTVQAPSARSFGVKKGPQLMNTRGGDITLNVNKTNVTGTVSYNLSDFSLDGGFKINPTKKDFGLNITIGARAYFDLTSSGSVSKAPVLKFDVPLFSEGLFGCNLVYQIYAEFNDVPVHVKGRIDNSVTYVFGIIGATFQNYNGPVTFETAELVNPDRDAGKTARFTIGSRLTTAASFAGFSLNLYFFEIKIGPVFELTVNLYADTDCTLVLEKDVPVSDNRTEESIHECSVPGNAGCYTLNTKGSKTTDVTLKVDLYFVGWTFTPYLDITDTGSKHYYNSLQHGTGFREGTCPYLLYRIPVEVRQGSPENYTVLEGYSVYPSGEHLGDLNDEVLPLMQDVTGADGRAVIYLPYREKYRYNLMAYNGEAAGTGRQSHDMRPGGNDTVYIYVHDLDTVSFLVRKNWEADADEQDVPENQPMFAVQELDPDTNRWHASTYEGEPVLITLQRLGRRWEGTGRSLPTYRRTDSGREAIRYRVRELRAGAGTRRSGESDAEFIARIDASVIYDRDDPEWNGQDSAGMAFYRIPAYISNTTGELVQEHQAAYLVNYDTDYGFDNCNYTVTVTNTAVVSVDVHKLWANVPEEERPDGVFAVLRSRPEAGWESRAALAGVNSSWQPVRDPLSGPTMSMNDLIDYGVMTAEVPRVKNDRLAITELEDENGWSAGYLVKKYDQGIPLRFMAEELDTEIVCDALNAAYDFPVEAEVTGNGEPGYVSFPGTALALQPENSWQRTACIVNAADEGSYTIGGVKYWVSSGMDEQVIPDSVDIVVIDRESGEEVARTTVTGPTDAASTRMWPWRVSSKLLSPDGSYEIREELPEEAAGNYYSTTDGYDLINYWTGGNNWIEVRIQKVWDPLYLKMLRQQQGSSAVPPPVTVSAVLGGRSRQIELTAADWFESVILGVRLNDPEELNDPAKFSIAEIDPPSPGLSSPAGAQFVTRYITSPAMTFEGGERVYTFTIVNMLQFEYDISKVRKSWDFGELTESDAVIPNSISIELLRNGDPYGPKVTTPKSWFYNYFGELEDLASLRDYDLAGGPMMRLDPDGNPYWYTIRETMDPAELMLTDEAEPGTGGYVASLTTYNTIDDPHLQYVLTNRWVPAKDTEFVRIQGTKRWKAEPWPANASFRPDIVYVYVLNGEDELVAVAGCEYDYARGAWFWSVDDLPRYDENGEQIAYHIQEKKTDGYTAFYDEPVFDEETKTWTCDMENQLGYAYTTVRKRILDGDPGPGDKFTFRIQPFLSENDRNAPKLRSSEIEITGEGESRFEFLLNGEGIFLYLLSEDNGGNSRYRYDPDMKGLLLVVEKGDDGVPRAKLYLLDESIDTNGVETFDQLLGRLRNGYYVQFINRVQDLFTVEKKWDIDLEDQDRPDYIHVAVQKKVPRNDPEEWETVAVSRLMAVEGWRAEIGVPKASEANPEYRVRELTADLETVYAPNDADNPDRGAASYVTCSVPERESVLAGGTAAAHETKYLVTYGMDGDTYTITNTAVTAVDVKKHWILLSEVHNKVYISSKKVQP